MAASSTAYANAPRERRSKRAPSPELTASVEVLRAADRVRVRATAVVKPHGLTLPQFNTLRILRGAAEPLPIMEVRRRLVERTPGITRLVDGLERMGFVQRCPDTADRRSTCCEITSAGLKLLRTLDRPFAENDRESLADLSRAEVLQLTRLAQRVR